MARHKYLIGAGRTCITARSEDLFDERVYRRVGNGDFLHSVGISDYHHAVVPPQRGRISDPTPLSDSTACVGVFIGGPRVREGVFSRIHCALVFQWKFAAVLVD